MTRNRCRSEWTLVYRKHEITPKDFLTFVELDGFRDDWERLGLNDDDLNLLQVAIMSAPTWYPVISGTGGVRKLRFSPGRMKRGKSGAFRVCYVYFEEFGIVLLAIAYGKNERDNLTTAEKNALRQYVARQQKQFSEGYFR